MPIVMLDASGPNAGAGSVDVEAALRAHDPASGVIVMIHGYRYTPRMDRHNAANFIYALTPRRRGNRSVSWPRQLGADVAGGPLCIGLNWPARGTIWAAQAQARQTGATLAALLTRSAAHGHRPGVIVHSLGATVALTALARIAAGTIDRMVLLSGAAFQADALAAMDSPAGDDAAILNVVSRENDAFDAALEWSAGAGRRAIGAGLGQDRRGWLDLQIDHPQVRTALAGLGHAIAPPGGAICHWSTYLRPGLFPLYRRYLSGAPELALPHLRRLLPGSTQPRWTRLARATTGVATAGVEPIGA